MTVRVIGSPLRCAALLALLLVAAAAAAATPLEQHMQRLLNDGDRWRTPNPGYDPANGGPEAYGLRFHLSPDGSHVTGQLTGIHPDGREALYWTLLAMYNPVTNKVVTQQIGANGTLLHGDVDIQPGPVQIVDMIEYAVDGRLSISRHENRFDAEGSHSSLVFEPDGEGGWRQTQSWTWIREQLPDDGRETIAPVAAGRLSAALQPHAGFLLRGSGRWRARNPDYVAGSDAEEFYGMNYRAGPHGQHVIGEIVSVYADGREQLEWTLYITHNPVTQRTWLEQTGASGVYFRGELGRAENGRRTQAGLVYLPNGQAKAVRDEIEIIDDRSYRAHVFERGADGAWQKLREWTWTLREDAAAGR